MANIETVEIEEVKTRRIRLVTIRGVSGSFEFRNGVVRKDLHEELARRDVNLNNTKIIEGKTRVTLELPTSVVPDGDIDLFLMQKRSKAGVVSKKPLKKPLKKVAKKVIKKVAKKVVKKATSKKATKVMPVVKKAVKKTAKKPVKAIPEKTKELPPAPVYKTEEELNKEFIEISNQLDDVNHAWNF